MNHTCLYFPAARRHRPFGWYSLRLSTKGWPGWVDLGGWLHTEINVPHRELNPDTVTHPSTNRAERILTSLIETNALPRRQTTTIDVLYMKEMRTVYAGRDVYRTWWIWSTAIWNHCEARRSCRTTRWSSCSAASTASSSFIDCFCRVWRTSSSELSRRSDPPTTSSGSVLCTALYCTNNNNKLPLL